jgi:uroporphyrinogen decarboxylase
MGDPGLCSFGTETTLKSAIEHLGQKSIIIGNIDTTLMLTGKPDEIYKSCKEAIEEGKKAPRGFMLSSACEIPPETPPYHVFMMTKAINDYGYF